MAQKKRRTRSTSRSPKRSSSRSSQRWSPVGLLLAVAVLGGVGLLAFWTKEQAKNPSATNTRSPVATASRAPSAVPRPEKEVRSPAKTALREDSVRTEIARAPVPRPSVPVGVPQQNPAATKPTQQASLQRPQGPIGKAIGEPPRGTNVPGMAPSVVYARDRLVLRRSASQASASIGSVEKGREMRSYSKAGKWHHIAVPTTGMIGWVHEDMLIKGRQAPNISSMTTGAIYRAPAQAVYPPRPVGAQ
ncbi:hypothetical protein V9K92_05145 [Phyllobacterium sp. CCNWLW109]|uniref:hypothetical protein n=1 Tax=Phyllobacterium sp. CCNWLW109 TaxID=3127479 RepID=UPI00307890D8